MGTGHRKPTGEIGPIILDAASRDAWFDPVEFPRTKEEIERFIAARFVANGNAKGWFPFKVVAPLEQNETDHLDFTLRTDQGTKYLELMETHLKDVGVEVPSGQFAYNCYEVAELVLARIREKSDRYARATHHGVILLTYVTHWQFCLSDTVYWLLAYWMRERQPIFESVFDIGYIDTQSFESRRLYPSSKDMSGFVPDKYRDNRTILFNPRGWRTGFS